MQFSIRKTVFEQLLTHVTAPAVTHKIIHFQSEHRSIVKEPKEDFEEIITRFNVLTRQNFLTNLLFYLC